MRRFYPTLLCFWALAILVAVGCSNPDNKAKAKTDADKGDGIVVLEIDEIELFPEGEAKSVKVKKGKAEKAEAPAGSGVTAKVEGDKVTVSAGKDAKVGTHEVKVKGDKKDATLKVNVKKKDK